MAYPKYERKIRTFSKIHFQSIPGMGRDDLENELQEVLWLVCESYDPNKGARFNTYFWQAVKNRVTDLKKSAFRQKRRVHASTTVMSAEALRYVIEDLKSNPSAEEELLARITVTERFRGKNRNL